MLPKFHPQYLLHSSFYPRDHKVYLGYFGEIPNTVSYLDMDMDGFRKEFSKSFRQQILIRNSSRTISRERNTVHSQYVLQEQIIVDVDTDDLQFLYQQESPLLTSLLDFAERFRIQSSEKSKIHLVIMGRDGLENKRMDFKKPELDFDRMYHPDFSAFHERMLKQLEQDQQSGLHLLHGKPGTGKSSYIKYLCSLLKKKVIFLSGQLAQNLDDVSMTRYLIDNSGSILVIEDAEELIITRGQQRNSNLAMVLNLTDGILGECLGIQIIATFNTDLRNIDPALTRKGRLRSSYEFRPLPVAQVNALLKSEGITRESEKELTLAEVFNIREEEQFKPQWQAVGFK